jgi:hypothetical protein
VRILPSLVVVLSGLLMAREFMAPSNEQFRLTLRGAEVVSEQSIATVHEPPALVAPMAVARIAEVSTQTIATVREPPALVASMAVARIAEVSHQNIATAHEPPAPVARIAVAPIAEVSEPNVATVHEPPALVAPVAVARIAEVSEQSIAVREPPALAAPVTVARIAEVSEQNVNPAILFPDILVVSHALGQRVAFKEGELTSLDPITDVGVATVHEPPPLVARIAEVSEQSIATVHELPALVAPMTECEQIWDQMTHMTRKEWAEACRRVDDEKQEISEGASILPGGRWDHRRARRPSLDGKGAPLTEARSD